MPCKALGAAAPQVAGKSGAHPSRAAGGVGSVTMDLVSTAIVVGIVVVLMLLGLGIVTNQLLRLRKYLNQAPPDQATGEDGREHPDNFG